VSITDIRNGIATNLRTITGLRATGEVPDQPNPPQAVVQLQNVDYDGAFQGGMTTYSFLVTVLVGRAAERAAQQKLNIYASTGAGGIKPAIESDKTLSGTAYDVRVETMTNISAVSLGGDISYLSADFIVTVLAN
jgi:hypothetical protein